MAYKKLDIGEPDLRQLTQYVSQEFDRVAQFLRAAQGAASILQSAPSAPIVVGTVPQILTTWDNTTPFFEFFAVQASLPDNGVWARRSGMYYVSFDIQGEVEVNKDYTFILTNNGVPTLLSALSDPSNQTDVVTVVGNGSQRLRATGVGGPGIDDLLQITIESSQAGTSWTTLNATLTVLYVAE